MDEIRKSGRDHGALAEIYNSNITSRCSDIHEDINRMYKKVIIIILVYFIEQQNKNTILISVSGDHI